MMIMPANNTKGIVHYFAGKYPGKIGLLISPKGWRSTVPEYLPYALDNGAYTGFDEVLFMDILRDVPIMHRPLWVVVPDVVGDATATTARWHVWHNRIPFPLAFAVQDGHRPEDVPKTAFCVFVGGSTAWKLANAHKFKGVTKWLHIGRVNTERRLCWAERIGADSVDGTGFFRGDQKQLAAFIEHFEGRKQKCLSF